MQFSNLMENVDRFVVSFNSKYVLVKGFVDDAAKKVKNECQKIFTEATQGMLI